MNTKQQERTAFAGNEFAIQVIARGSYLDTGTHPGEIYPVEITTIRLNHVALERWHKCAVLNTRDVYDTDTEWLQYRDKKNAKREAWNTDILKALGIEGTAVIEQAHAEVFVVVQITEFKPAGS